MQLNHDLQFLERNPIHAAGQAFQEQLEQQIGQIRAAAVFVGDAGVGPWQNMELSAFLRQFVKRKCPVIPVLLETASSKPKLPVLLEGHTWVDLRKQDPDPLSLLIWGFTGERPEDLF